MRDHSPLNQSFSLRRRSSIVTTGFESRRAKRLSRSYPEFRTPNRASAHSKAFGNFAQGIDAGGTMLGAPSWIKMALA